MGSSYFPRINTSASYSITGPTGPTGERGETGPTGYGPTGNTGPSVIAIGICGDKLRTTFDTGFTFETSNPIKGYTGNTILIAGLTFGGGISIFSGQSLEGGTLYFRQIRGRTSISGRAEVSVGISGSSVYIDYINQSSGLTIGITGSETIRTFVGYSGSTLISISKTYYGTTYSSFAAKNVFEKARGLGYSAATSISGVTCNYIDGGTLGYVDAQGYAGFIPCKILYIDPNCVGNNSVDVQIRNKVFVADMKNNVTRVILGNASHTTVASAITLVVMNAINGPTAIGQAEKRFKLASATGSIMWPFDKEPCFCGNTAINVYHLYNMGGYTWYGSVGSMTDASKFFSCPNGKIVEGITEGYGACCYADGTPGGTCFYETEFNCNASGASAFWHQGVICGSSPCAKTGGCCISITAKPSEGSPVCLSGITCINCISGNISAYPNAFSYKYLGNGVTCTSGNCPGSVT